MLWSRKDNFIKKIITVRICSINQSKPICNVPISPSKKPESEARDVELFWITWNAMNSCCRLSFTLYCTLFRLIYVFMYFCLPRLWWINILSIKSCIQKVVNISYLFQGVPKGVSRDLYPQNFHVLYLKGTGQQGQQIPNLSDAWPATVQFITWACYTCITTFFLLAS